MSVNAPKLGRARHGGRVSHPVGAGPFVSRVRLCRPPLDRCGPASLGCQARSCRDRPNGRSPDCATTNRPQDSIAARRSRQVGAPVRRGVCVGRAPGVEAIFPDTAVHVVKTEPIGGEGSRLRCRPTKYSSRALVVGTRSMGKSCVQSSSSIKIARKSLTLVKVGPVTT